MELIAEDTLTLNCTALVEFNTGLEIQWSYPGKLVRAGITSDTHTHTHSGLWKSGVQTCSCPQTNSWVEIKPYREALASATEVASILTIHKVNANDTGSYSCNVTSTDTTQIQQTQVKVHGEQQPRTEQQSGLLASAAPYFKGGERKSESLPPVALSAANHRNAICLRWTNKRRKGMRGIYHRDKRGGEFIKTTSLLTITGRVTIAKDPFPPNLDPNTISSLASGPAVLASAGSVSWAQGRSQQVLN